MSKWGGENQPPILPPAPIGYRTVHGPIEGLPDRTAPPPGVMLRVHRRRVWAAFCVLGVIVIPEVAYAFAQLVTSR